MQDKKTLPLYEEFDENIADIIFNKYLLKDKTGNPIDRSYADMVERWMTAVRKYPQIVKKSDLDDLEQALLDRDLLLGGSIAAGLGTQRAISLSNCYVIPSAKDNYESIIANDAAQTHIMKRRGGVGHDLSNIRPKGSPVNNAALTSTGIVPFMTRYSNSTLEVAQDGRRGALMLSLDEKHPDALDFVNAKTDIGAITGANISLRATEWLFSATTLFHSLLENMYESAEPGLLFWDNIMNNPIDAMLHKDFKTISTNPCGEIPLNAYGSCILAHINMYNMVDNQFRDFASINQEKLERTTELGIKLLNVVVEEELKHIDRIKKLSEPGVEKTTWLNIRKILRQGRRIGLGRTGVGDMLAALGHNYDNSLSTRGIIESTSKVILRVAYETSCNIPITAPIFEEDANHEAWLNHSLYFDLYNSNQAKPANVGLLTIAPVGTGSMVAGVTSGMEPLFAYTYKRKRRAMESEDYTMVINGKRWIETTYVHKPLLDFGYAKGMIKNDKVDVEELYAASPYYLNTAKDIRVEDKIHLQAIMQRYVDQSISVTHNIPKDYPKEELKDLVILAHSLKLKGFTVYREGSREGILTSIDEIGNNSLPLERPPELDCNVHNVKVDGKDWTVIVSLYDNKPYELFALKVKNLVVKDLKGARLIKEIKGDRTFYNLESSSLIINDLTSIYSSGNEEVLTRLISSRLREGTPVSSILESFNKVEMTIGTFEQVVKRVLSKYVESGSTGEVCSECGAELTREDGCVTCKSCGYNKCG